METVVWFDVASALADPRELDRLRWAPRSGYAGLAKEASAVWLDGEHLIVGATNEPEDPDDEAEHATSDPHLKPNGIAVYDAVNARCVRDFVLAEPPGRMMALGSDFVVAFFRHPRLVSLRTGRVLHTFSELESGLSVGPIDTRPNGPSPPPLALDPSGARFAVARGNVITVVQFDLAELAKLDAG